MGTFAADDPLGAAFRDAVGDCLRTFIGGQTARLTSVGPQLEALSELALAFTAGGKRLRPAFCWWGYCAVAEPEAPEALLRAASSLDLLHVSALVHDDVMDESDSRRGAPSAHVQAAAWHREAGARGDADTFGRNLAILAGDLAHARAGRLADGLAEPLRETWHELCLELIAGQRADLTGAAAGRRDREHAERIARLKSGSYSVGRPLQLGALAAGASAEQHAALHAYGVHVGRAFALRDDLLGVWGDPAVTGKPAGDDLISGKATVILALAVEALSGPDAELLTSPATDVRAVIEALERAGIDQRVEDLISAEIRCAKGALADAPLAPDGIAGLHELAATIAWRQA